MGLIERVGRLALVLWLMSIATVLVLTPLFFYAMENDLLPELNIVSHEYNTHTSKTSYSHTTNNHTIIEKPILREVGSGEVICLHINGVKECYEQ